VTEDEVPIALLCVGKDHLRHGRAVPDGDGHLTVVEQQWAYCSAGLEDESHIWRPIHGMTLAGIRHSDLDRYGSHEDDADPKDPGRRA
jgi:hypothetical protein